MNTTFPEQRAPEQRLPVQLFRHPISGHCHRVELMLSLLDIPYQTVDLDLQNGAHKQADYLKISPFGQVPAINDNGVTLSDSNAIIVYLAKTYHQDYQWYPQDPLQAAEVQRWLSVAAGEIAHGPCAMRLVKVFGAQLDYDVAKRITESLFSVVEAKVETSPYLVGESITLADVAAYSYIAHVPEGGLSLEPYPAIRAWLARIEAHPRFVGMKRTL